MIMLKDHFKYRPFKSKKVLLVDDEKDLGWIMKKVVRDAGHMLICATTVKEGMEKFKRLKNLNITIVDLKLEDEDGLAFIKKAKEVANKKVDFIMISAFGTPDIERKARHLGVHHFLHKPLKVDRLLDIISSNS